MTAARREGAEERLRRLLHLIPAAARAGGVDPAELARDMGVDERQLLRDLEEVTERSFYLPAGAAEELQILVEPGRVRIWTKGELRRPVKLSPIEALCAALGLRAVQAGGDPDGDGAESDGRRRLLERIEGDLAALPAEDVRVRWGAPSPDARFALADLDADPEGVRETMVAAARERRPCSFRYLKPDADGPEERTIEPWVIACGGGAWYAVGRCRASDGVRVFRVDRILDARLEEGRFEPPASFDAAEHLGEGRVYFPATEERARVRYSPRIARWLAEHVGGEIGPDGALVAEHGVSDPGWLVRHVLGYGADAEVLAPEGLRRMVEDAARRVAG